MPSHSLRNTRQLKNIESTQFESINNNASHMCTIIAGGLNIQATCSYIYILLLYRPISAGLWPAIAETNSDITPPILMHYFETIARRHRSRSNCQWKPPRMAIFPPPSEISKYNGCCVEPAQCPELKTSREVPRRSVFSCSEF